MALPDNHPLAAKSTIKVQDLKGQTLLLLEDGHCLRDQALEVCSRIDVREAEDFRATSLETLRQMVVAGLGITLLPELAVESPFGSQRGMTIRRFAKPAPTAPSARCGASPARARPAIAAVCGVVDASWRSRPESRAIIVTAVSAGLRRAADADICRSFHILRTPEAA